MATDTNKQVAKIIRRLNQYREFNEKMQAAVDRGQRSGASKHWDVAIRWEIKANEAWDEAIGLLGLFLGD